MTDKTKTLLLFDMDGVVVDWYGGVLDHLKEFPEIAPVPENQLTSFILWDNYPPSAKEILSGIIRRKGFYSSLKPLENSIETLQRLALSPRFEVFLCTSPELEDRKSVV